jgi:hypothetical protein
MNCAMAGSQSPKCGSRPEPSFANASHDAPNIALDPSVEQAAPSANGPDRPPTEQIAIHGDEICTGSNRKGKSSVHPWVYIQHIWTNQVHMKDAVVAVK